MGQQPSTPSGASAGASPQVVPARPGGPATTSTSADLSIGQQAQEEDSIPYTAYSQEKELDDDDVSSEPGPSVTQSLPAYPQRRGVTIVNTLSDASWRVNKPIELQKLDKVHRFWPILKSSVESMPPSEKINDGVHYKEILSLCVRLEEHLSEAAKVVGTEQKALASRLKDIEMFSAGIMQQMIRRQESLIRTNSHLQKVKEVEEALTKIKTTLDSCVPQVRRLNSYLPKENRLEAFRLNIEIDSDREESYLESEDNRKNETNDEEETKPPVT